jgi:hypothetical protein
MLTTLPAKETPVAELTQERMACMEVWGGNRSIWSNFMVPGLDI